MTEGRVKKVDAGKIGIRKGGKIGNRNLWTAKIATDIHRRTRTFFGKIVSMVLMVEVVWNVNNIMFVSNLLFGYLAFLPQTSNQKRSVPTTVEG
jgi:hypothetical protein